MAVTLRRATLDDLPTPKLSDTTEEKIRKHEIYDRLQPYACQPLTAIDDAGRQRFRGPAHKHVRRVRCPNSPRSMRWSILPKTRCIKGEPCICSTTFTLGPVDELKTRRPLDQRQRRGLVAGTDDQIPLPMTWRAVERFSRSLADRHHIRPQR